MSQSRSMLSSFFYYWSFHLYIHLMRFAESPKNFWSSYLIEYSDTPWNKGMVVYWNFKHTRIQWPSFLADGLNSYPMSSRSILSSFESRLHHNTHRDAPYSALIRDRSVSSQLEWGYVTWGSEYKRWKLLENAGRKTEMLRYWGVSVRARIRETWNTRIDMSKTSTSN